MVLKVDDAIQVAKTWPPITEIGAIDEKANLVLQPRLLENVNQPLDDCFAFIPGHSVLEQHFFLPYINLNFQAAQVKTM